MGKILTMADAMIGTPADQERFLNQETVRAAVMRMITCQRTGKVLDMRTAVYVLLVKGELRRAYVFTGDAWDAMKDDVAADAVAAGATIEVTDGREVFA